jgi:glycine cleavage system H protein
MKIPNQLMYTTDHEWIKFENNHAIVGITDFAQSELGEIVFIEFPEEGDTFEKGDTMGTIEAVKTVADFYAPLSGIVVKVNQELENQAECLNTDPFGDGWLIKLEPTNLEEKNELLSAEDYQKLID